MKARLLAVALVAACLVFFVSRSDSGKEPDEKLVDRLDDLCEIARDNADSPTEGVRALGRYFATNTEGFLGDWGAMIQMIERIPDDDEHDERAMLARDRIASALRACEGDWERFAEAVESDPEASALLERGIDRLGRTLEIIFQGERDAFGLRSWYDRLVAI